MKIFLGLSMVNEKSDTKYQIKHYDSITLTNIQTNEYNIITDAKNIQLKSFNLVYEMLKTLREHLLGPNDYLLA